MSSPTDNEPLRSRDRILELLLRSEEPLGVQALSEALGVSRNAAHQHVAALEGEGLIERASPIRTKGRPSRGFRLSPAGRTTFPRQYALLSKQLLLELSRHLGPAPLAEAMRRIGKTLASGLAGQIDPADPIPSIAALMRELGYEIEVGRRRRGPCRSRPTIASSTIWQWPIGPSAKSTLRCCVRCRERMSSIGAAWRWVSVRAVSHSGPPSPDPKRLLSTPGRI